MILTALVELAHREELIAKPDTESVTLSTNPNYQPVKVRWLAKLSKEGQLLGPFLDTVDYSTPSKAFKKTNKPQPRMIVVPKRSARTSGVRAEFVVDNVKYALGWLDTKSIQGMTADERAGEAVKVAACHAAFAQEIKAAADKTGDEGLLALATYLQSRAAQDDLAFPEGLAAADNVGFILDGDNDLISSRPSVVDYWSTRRFASERRGKAKKVSRGATKASPIKCLVTDIECIPVTQHAKPKNLPPEIGGVYLTSINKSKNPAFESYGIGSIGSAPISQDATDAIEKALNRLLADGYPHPETGAAMAKRNFRLTDDTVVVFWSKADPNLVDIFVDAFAEADPNAVAALYSAPYKGSRVDLDDSSAFYALTLTGGQGRGTVRGWHETRLDAVLSNVRRHFDDIDIVRPVSDAGPLPLLQLLRQTAVKGELKKVPSALAGDVFTAVLTGRPFPHGLLEALIRRVRAEREIYTPRAAFLKAYLCRAGVLPAVRPTNDHPTPSSQERFVSLNEDFREPGYRLGRLFAVLERLQDDAIKASAGIRDRYYGSASATPVVVFPQLLRKAPHHLSKLGGGSETYYEKLIQKVCDGLELPTPFPPTLTLEQQGLFAVGYYHQRQALFTKREKAADATSEPTAPTEEN